MFSNRTELSVNPFVPGFSRYNFLALCCVGLKFVFPHNFFIAVTSEKNFFSKIEWCVNPRPAVMTGVQKMSLGLFFFFFFSWVLF